MPTTHELTIIIEQLDNWVEDHYTDEEKRSADFEVPSASFTYGIGEAVQLGLEVLWDSESSPSEPELSFETVRDNFLRIVFSTSRFWRAAQQLCDPDGSNFDDPFAAFGALEFEQLNIRIDELEKELESEKSEVLRLMKSIDRANERNDEMLRHNHQLHKQARYALTLYVQTKAHLEKEVVLNDQLDVRIKELTTTHGDVMEPPKTSGPHPKYTVGSKVRRVGHPNQIGKVMWYSLGDFGQYVYGIEWEIGSRQRMVGADIELCE